MNGFETRDAGATLAPLRSNTDLIKTVVGEAEAAAQEIIDVAAKEAEAHVDDVRTRTSQEAAQQANMLAELSRSLVHQVEVLHERAESIQQQLDALIDDMGTGQPTPDPEADRLKADPAAAPDAEGTANAADEPSFSPGARLLATQMAISGNSREEIRERLSVDFGIGDPDALLDIVMGPR